MRIIECKGNKYIDQDLFNYINQIWCNYDIEIQGKSNLFFAKNTTVNRMVSDYTGTELSRVIKREKADYVVINKFNINNYPQFYDGSNITNDDNQEVVYPIYNNNIEDIDTVELILDFINRKQEVKYVNQDKLNESLNNGFVLDKESYITVKELIDSPHEDNHELAVNMLIKSDLKSNWEWILYLYYKKAYQLDKYDRKHIIKNYFNTLNLGYSLAVLSENIDLCLSKVKKNEDVKSRFIYIVKNRFQKNIEKYFKEVLGTTKFDLQDFKIVYNESK